MGWKEIAIWLSEIRPFETGFDGQRRLDNYFRTGKFTIGNEPDIDKIRKISKEFKLDSEALKFLNDEDTSESNGSSGTS